MGGEAAVGDAYVGGLVAGVISEGLGKLEFHYEFVSEDSEIV